MARLTPGPRRIAFDVVGEGEQVLVVIPGWVSHLDYDWSTPEIRNFYEGLASGRRVIRYDKRGVGLSERPEGADVYSLDHQVEDLLSVLDAAGAPRVAIFAWSMGGPIALALAAKQPQRVVALLLYGTYARALTSSDYAAGIDADTMRSLMTLSRAQWGIGSRALADFFVPESDEERVKWFTMYQRVAMSPQTAADFVAGAMSHDVRNLLPEVKTPTLVLHRREDAVIPLSAGRFLAEQIPGALFRELSGIHHTPYFGDSKAVISSTDHFLRSLEHTPRPVARLTKRELEVLCLVSEGLQNQEIADRITVSRATVGRHLANIYTKLGVSTRAAAAAYALRSGIV
jgi:pimeloyl-ACP methyl ester carboxylesterase/DNA-binding CsgD family transcriptional regulator